MTSKKFVRVLVRVGDKVLVMKNNHNEHETWNLPGGKIEENETAISAAKREVFEECGIHTDQLVCFHQKSYLIDGVLWDGNYFFTEIFKGEPSIQEPDKCSEMGFKTIQEISELPSMNELLIEPLKLLMT